MVIIRSGSVLTASSVGRLKLLVYLPEKYLDSCLPTKLHQPNPEVTLK